MVRLGRWIVGYILGAVFDDWAIAILGGTGVGFVITTVLLASVTAFRTLPDWQQRAFYGGWTLIAYFAMWIAWPTIRKWRASSRAEAIAIADTIKREMASDNPYQWPQIVRFDAQWILTDVQNLLKLDMLIQNPTPYDMHIKQDYEGAIKYRGSRLAPARLEAEYHGNYFNSVTINQPLSDATIAAMNADDGPVALDMSDFRASVEWLIAATSIKKSTALLLPDDMEFTPPARLSRNGPEIRERLTLQWRQTRPY